MDTNSINKPAAAPVKGSRLPAGSTLEIAPGVHVPHPEAEVNLPGAGDPRLGDTAAVTEKAVIVDGAFSIEQKPLADEVRVSNPNVNTPTAAVTDTTKKPVAAVQPSVTPAQTATDEQK